MPRVNKNHKNSGQTALWLTKAFIEGLTPLMVAIRRGHTDIVKLLLEHPEIKVNLRDNNGKTALMHAAISGSYEMVSLLLEREDVEVDIQDKNGETALIHARRGRNRNLIRVIRSKCVHQRCEG